MIRVITDLGGKVEGYAQTGLPPLQKIAKPPVRILGRTETGVLAHRPISAAVHVRLNPSCKGILAWGSQIPEIIELGQIGRCVERFHRQPGEGFELRLGLRHLILWFSNFFLP